MGLVIHNIHLPEWVPPPATLGRVLALHTHTWEGGRALAAATHAWKRGHSMPRCSAPALPLPLRALGCTATHHDTFAPHAARSAQAVGSRLLLGVPEPIPPALPFGAGDQPVIIGAGCSGGIGAGHYVGLGTRKVNKQQQGHGRCEERLHGWCRAGPAGWRARRKDGRPRGMAFEQRGALLQVTRAGRQTCTPGAALQGVLTAPEASPAPGHATQRQRPCQWRRRWSASSGRQVARAARALPAQSLPPTHAAHTQLGMFGTSGRLFEAEQQRRAHTGGCGPAYLAFPAISSSGLRLARATTLGSGRGAEWAGRPDAVLFQLQRDEQTGDNDGAISRLRRQSQCSLFTQSSAICDM